MLAMVLTLTDVLGEVERLCDEGSFPCANDPRMTMAESRSSRAEDSLGSVVRCLDVSYLERENGNERDSPFAHYRMSASEKKMKLTRTVSN